MKKLSLILLLISQLTFAQKIIFQLEAPANGPYSIHGNTPPLSWEKGIVLKESDGKYAVEIDFDAANLENIEFKYTKGNGQNLIWEPFLENRFLKVENGTQENEWGKVDKIDLSTLKIIPSAKLLEDYTLVDETFRKLHPGALRYQSKESFDKNLAELKSSFSRDLTYQQAYLYLTKFAASVKCGHTHTGVYNQSNLINQILLEQPDKLSFLYRIIDKKIYITANASEIEQIAIGSEIKRINGINVETILDSLLPYMSADGSNDAKRFWSMQLTADPSNQVADAYFPLLFPPQNGIYNIEIQNPDSKRNETFDIQAINRDERSERLLKRNPDFPKTTEDLWSYKMLNKDLAYLKMGTFGVFNMSLDWKKFLKEAFATFKKNNAKNLIIDIRGNEGGMDEVSMETARYLISETTKIDLPKFESRASYQVVPDHLRPYLSTWDADIYDIRDKTNLGEDGFYYFGENTRNLILEPKENGFYGNVYLMTDASNSSATFYMAGNYRKMGLATLVGQTTGASKKSINGGHYFFLNLPNSRVEIDVAVMSSVAAEEKDEGIVPDIYIKQNPSDIAAGIDTELNFMIKYLSTKSK